LIYAAFTVWLLATLFAGVAVWRLWTGLVRPAWVNWVLLPGTIVSEMAYIFGCLITGGEIRRAKLLDLRGDKRGGEARTEAAGGLKVVGPLLASLLTIVACAAAILAVRRLLGSSMIEAFTLKAALRGGALPQELPASWDGLWQHLHRQLTLLRRMCETLAAPGWLNWRGILFVYLTACLSVRLSPVTRPLRPTLAAVVVIAGGIAAAGLLWDRFADLMTDLWPLLAYVWATVLFLLAVTLLVRGVVGLVGILAGRRGI
jgi:hypothetical protein